MARTSQEVTEQEKHLYNRFAEANLLANYGEQGIKNAEILGGVILGQDQDITVDRLVAAFKQVRTQLTFISAVQQQADKLANELAPQDLSAVRVWFERQSLIGLDGTDQGYSNFIVLVDWIRAHGFAIDPAHLNMAISNVMSGRNQLYWKPEPKQSTSLLKNHAKDVAEQPKSDGRKYAKDGRINHAYSEPDRPVTTPHVVDAWETLSYDLTKNGTHSQQAQLVQVLNRARAEGKQWRQIYTELESAKRQFENKVVVR